MKKAITDIKTGITELIDMTADEIAEYNSYKAKADAEIEIMLQARAEAEAKKDAAQNKLAALGLTADDLKALGL